MGAVPVSKGLPGLVDFEARQRGTFSRTLTYSNVVGGVKTPVDITGWAAAMQVKSPQNLTTPVVSIASGSGITLGGAAGTVTITISDDVMATLTEGVYVWDLWLYPPIGDSVPLMAGEMHIRNSVTNA